MAQAFLLIDGYNLMHAAGMARRRYGPGEFERARGRFLRFLARHLDVDERVRTTVVFDAAEGPTDVQRSDDFDGMHVRFSEHGSDADSMIEALIAHHSAPRQLRVVSSDHRLRSAARRRRARSVDSETFLAELETREVGRTDRHRRASAVQPSHPKYSGQLTREQAEAWLAYFGDCDDLSGKGPDQDEIAFWQAMIEELDDDLGEDPESTDR